ncbi:hypothetical protein BJ684DRAFT_10569 [Piptocephalis cylindrospora]|uniref:Nop domain-containing protein n=1 Tax=Piptocephalis cylindrospora TaxID=1907219 RepID=A0A4P9Y328_9FUNG|nr:hypothetical protein BJ684DRAFT_10569 [Piptocephalis cylindrospora]|eukprot:RKP13074.1 hypothetical protein BJ684DRAFT_10569 [Piptocephalis cylindrospora]
MGSPTIKHDSQTTLSEGTSREASEEAPNGSSGHPSVRNVAKLWHSSRLRDTMAGIRKYQEDDSRRLVGMVEEDPEYKLVVQGNRLIVDIDNEVILLHKYLRDVYVKRFEELETLTTNPYTYARALKAIGNHEKITESLLDGILPPAVIMVMVTATLGPPLDPEALENAKEGADMLLSLEEARDEILGYVESRMGMIAPNLSALVGSATAAQMIGSAGGLTSLSRMPACNVQVLGANKVASNMGFSKATVQRHIGFVYHADPLKDMQGDLRTKGVRILAAKCSLASRVDVARTSEDGEMGRGLREQVEQKLEKLQEPAPNRGVKALPAPDEMPKKRRGGRRARKQKESLQMSEMRKAQNRVQFGVAEEEILDGDEMVGLGMAGSAGVESGKIRASAGDKRKVGMSKATVKRLRTMSGTSGGGSAHGLSTSLVFTPVQGIELQTPQAPDPSKRLKEINEGWFSSMARFKKEKDSTGKGSN